MLSASLIIGILVAAVVGMVINIGWYTLFGGVWRQLAERPDDGEEGRTQYLLNFAILLITAAALGILMQMVDIASIEEGIQVTVLGWLGFAATVTLQDVVWEDKPVQLYLFSNLQTLLAFIAIGVTLSIFLT